MDPTLEALMILALSLVGTALAIVLLRRFTVAESGKTYSLSKLQLLLWTLAISVTYTIVLVRLYAVWGGDFASPGRHIRVSEQLLLLMGISAGAFVVAKGLRSHQASKTNGADPPTLLTEPVDDGKKPSLMDYVSNLKGDLDLSKLQMLIWTVIGLFAYMVRFVSFLGTLKSGSTPDVVQLPDIDPMFVTLMGISQTAYIARKAVPERPEAAETTP